MRIGLVGDNSIEMIEQMINIWNDGNCVVLVDWRIPYNSIIEMLESVDVKRCYVEKKLLDTINPQIERNTIEFISYISMDTRWTAIPVELYNRFQSYYSDSEALILFSSGTTGKAKGVVLSHYAINLNADEVFKYMELEKSDSMYILKSLCHASTLVCELIVALKYRIKMFISPTVTIPNTILKNIVNHQITVICLNPTILKLITLAAEKGKYSFKGLKKVYCSGAVLDMNLLERAQRVLGDVKILNVYGLTEAGPRVTAQIPNTYDTAGSVGKVLDCASVKIVDEHGMLKRVNEKGIIYVKTLCKFGGYANLKDKKNEEEWINTKDIGYINDNNELFVLGRSDNMINIDSHNVFVEEIEQRILEMSSIDDCLVYGVINDSGHCVLSCDYVGEIEEDKEIINYLRKYLPPYEIPRKYTKVNSITYTLNGKKMRTRS